MNLRDYQAASSRTAAKSGDDRWDAIVSAIGLCGEAGEVAELLKKHHGHGKDLDSVRLAEEIGDVLWYLADIATRAHLDLGNIAARNVDKLRGRYPDGFTPQQGELTDERVSARQRLSVIEDCLRKAQAEWSALTDLGIYQQTRIGFQDSLGNAIYWAGDAHQQVANQTRACGKA